MAGDYLKRVERVRIKMDFMKKLRVGGAGTFQIRTPRVSKSYVLSSFLSSTTCLMKVHVIGSRQTA